jgi:hypothetical protein
MFRGVKRGIVGPEGDIQQTLSLLCFSRQLQPPPRVNALIEKEVEILNKARIGEHEVGDLAGNVTHIATT